MEYHFKYQNNKGGKYFLLSIFGPFVTIFPSIFLYEYVHWIFWLSTPLTIFIVVYGLWRFHKTSFGSDVITVDNEGFTSKDYGRVLFTDIHSIPPYGPLQPPPPSMRIRLNNGKKIVWHLNANNPKGKEDALTFIAFTEVLLQHLRRHEQALSGEISMEALPDIENIANRPVTKAPLKGPAVQTEVIRQLEGHRNRNVNHKYITIPIGLAFAILAFWRTCVPDMIREHKNKEFQVLRNAVLSEETEYQENVEEAKRVAKAYCKKFGAIYLYTNDPRASAAYIPDIRKDRYQPEANVIGIRRIEDNKLMRKYIEHPDSVSYQLAVLNHSMKYSAIMRKSIFATEDSTAAVVYFSVYNPTESLPVTLRQRSDTTFRPIRYFSSINIPKDGKLKKHLLENMEFASVRAILLKYEGTYFYMAVKAADGIQPEKFVELRKLVGNNLEEHGINIDSYQDKRFNVE